MPVISRPEVAARDGAGRITPMPSSMTSMLLVWSRAIRLRRFSHMAALDVPGLVRDDPDHLVGVLAVISVPVFM